MGEGGEGGRLREEMVPALVFFPELLEAEAGCLGADPCPVAGEEGKQLRNLDQSSLERVVLVEVNSKSCLQILDECRMRREICHATCLSLAVKPGDSCARSGRGRRPQHLGIYSVLRDLRKANSIVES